MVTAASFQSVGRKAFQREALLLTAREHHSWSSCPVLLLAARLFSLTGIWASEAISELIRVLCPVFWLKHRQTDAQWRYERTAICASSRFLSRQARDVYKSERPLTNRVRINAIWRTSATDCASARYT